MRIRDELPQIIYNLNFNKVVAGDEGVQEIIRNVKAVLDRDTTLRGYSVRRAQFTSMRAWVYRGLPFAAASLFRVRVSLERIASISAATCSAVRLLRPSA
jgi:hypothetical protein